MLATLQQAKDMYDSEQDDDTKDVLRDWVIQRLEYCIEYAWKLLRKVLQYEWYEEIWAKNIVRKAWELKILWDLDVFLEMIQSSNQLSHMYDEEIADDIFVEVPHFIQSLHLLLSLLNERYGKE